MHKQRLYGRAFAAAFTLVAGTAAAQEPLADDIVVTATRTPRAGTIAATIVINRETIAASQAKDVTELLRFHAGVDIGRNGGPGQTASVFIRGGESNHTLVLVDGVKINPGTIGAAALQNIDPDLIERIEIVKGPRSTLYGSEAIGGVIQIFTRRGAAGTTFDAKAGAGADATRELGAAVHHNDGAWRAGADIKRYVSDGFPARTGATQNSGHRRNSVNGYLGIKSGGIDAELSHWQTQGNTEYYDFFLAPLDQDFTNAATALTFKSAPTSAWASTLRLSRLRDEIDQKQGSDFLRTRRSVLDWQNDIQLNREHLLTAGLALSRENAGASVYGTGFAADTTVNEVYAQDQAQFGAHQLLGALRYTDHAAFGGHTTAELGYGYAVNTRWRLTGSVATGFRAPDATDRFGYGGNPDLKPETARNVELGAQLALAPGQTASIALFQNDVDDLISFVDPDGYLGPVPGALQNVERARIRGVEAGYRLQLKPWTLHVAGVLQDPENRDTGRQLARRAKQSFTLSAAYTGAGYRIGADLLATGRRPDSDFSTDVNVGYALVNLHAQTRLARDWELRARVENLFDKDYVLAEGFNTQGRALFVELAYRYGAPAEAGR